MLLQYTVIVALAVSAPPPDSNKARQIGVAEALQIISERLPQLLGARARMEASGAGAHSARGKLLPSVHLSDSQSWAWSKFDISSKLLPPSELKAFSMFPSDVTYNLFSASARQPLLGLGHLVNDYQAADAQADAGQADFRAAQADARANVQAAFLRLFEAQALADTAEASRRDLEEQVTVAQSKVDAGALTTADVLRLKVAAANAKQQVIAANAQRVSMRASLLEMLGFAGDRDANIEFLQPDKLLELPPAPDFAQMREQALQKRPELEGRRLQARAASHRASARAWNLLPELSVDAGYTHAWLEPFGTKQPTGPINIDSTSVGLSASWGIWEWGASYYEYEQASLHAKAADADAQSAAEQIGTEVAARHSDLVATMSAVDVANAQVDSAQEAYRVTQALSRAGSATTTDLLDAEAALTQARMGLVRARYEAAVASVALTRAAGE